MSFEQARTALQQAGINFQGKEKELEESEELQEAVIALAQIGALNTNIWQKVQSNPDIQEPITTMIKHAVLRVGVTGEPQPTPVDPKYQKASSIIANMVIDNFHQYFSTGLIADRTARAWERIQDDERFRDTVLTIDKVGSLSPNVLKTMQTDGETVRAITTLNQAGLLPLPEEKPSPFQDHEALLESAGYLHENHILSLEEYKKYQAILALYKVNMLSQETFKQVQDSENPINTAVKMLICEALIQAANSLDRSKRHDNATALRSFIDTAHSWQGPLTQLFLKTAYEVSRRKKFWQTRSDLKTDGSNMPKPYKAAEPFLKATQELIGVGNRILYQIIRGKVSCAYNTHSNIQDTMEKAKKSPQLVPHSTEDNDDVASPIGDHQL
ncbi:hypothetical protein [Piscirickettsia salmonis]|uniref:hypothetical protein n=1 Tax=Piscirickettsia salmonis TaxID=1238 RepID=UPI0007C8DC85|nr:hypothetical protein A0O36_02165 [Piscirickettsiaceae bacterium NZ-RLO1]